MTVLTATPSQTGSPQPIIEETLWRIRVDQYHEMINAGILTDDDPIELLEGLLVEKISKKPPHRVVTLLLRRMLEQLVASGWYIDSQEPITTLDSEPEPDATLHRDRGIKKRLYARAGIPVYWVVNLNKLQIEVYSQPNQAAQIPDYRQQQLYQGEEQLPVVLDGQEIGRIVVKTVLPPQLISQEEE